MSTTPEMADLSAADQARKALRHALRQIHERAPVAWYLGHGTQTFALLTEALAAHSDKSIDEIREIYCPAAQREFKGEELNDCPFCGSQRFAVTDDFRFHVKCLDCEAVGPGAWDAEEAREKWNARQMPR